MTPSHEKGNARTLGVLACSLLLAFTLPLLAIGLWRATGYRAAVSASMTDDAARQLEAASQSEAPQQASAMSGDANLTVIPAPGRTETIAVIGSAATESAAAGLSEAIASYSVTRNFVFGYYGMEEPVENPAFTPRVHIDSGLSPETMGFVFDAAAAGGVQVYQYLPAGTLGIPLATLRDQWIRPAVAYGPEVMAGFYIPEEPGEAEIPAMIDIANLIREEDSLGRPVLTYLGHLDVNPIIRFRDAIDIDLLGAYPVYKGYPQAVMTGVMESGRLALWPVNKRFYAVPETFGPILTDAQGPLRLRNNVYQAVIGGADGIICYTGDGFNRDLYPAFRAELDRLHEELMGSGRLSKVALAPPVPQTVTHTVLSGPTDLIALEMFEYTRYYGRLQYRLAVYEGEVYLIAANVAAEPLMVQFSGLPTVASQAEVLFEGRNVPVSAGSFQDEFSAYAVHTYRAPGALPPGFVLDVVSPTPGLVTAEATLQISGTVTPVAAVTVDGLVMTPAPTGAFSGTLPLTEGTHTIAISTPSAAVTRTVTLDTIPPETVITSAVGSETPPFTFAWEGSDSGSGVLFYSYRFDDGEWSLWTNYQVKTFDGDEYAALHLTTGSHTFEVRARDRAGNIDPTPAAVTFHVTATFPPTAPTITGPTLVATGYSYAFAATSTDLDRDRISYRFFWDDGTRSDWSALAPSGQPVTFTHSWAEGGRYFVRVQARDEHGMTIPWSGTSFHQVDVRGPITRALPFGYYGIEGPVVENTNFTPRVFIDSGMIPQVIPYVMNLAASGGVQVYQYMPAGILGLPLTELRDKWVRPAVAYGADVMAGFYLAEEPGQGEIPAMINILNLAHEEDPLCRPVVTYLGYLSTHNIVRFRDMVDIDLLGAYPVFKGYPQGVMTGIMDSARQALWPAGKRFYGVVETFGEVLTHPQGPLLLRNNVYQGIIGGADGIMCYTGIGFNRQRYPAFRAELDRLYEEINGSGGLSAVILSPDPPQIVSHTIITGPTDKITLEMFENTRYYERIQYRLKSYGGDVYLLAVNIAAEPLTVEFRGLPVGASELEVLFEGRKVSLSGRVLRDTFGPYEVHIYKALDYRQVLPLILRR